MFLKRLEIYGFKSFGTKSVLDFADDKNVSHIAAIVGPNGSGKSNIADAFRWVLGEQSTKNLRSKKNEDVIFCGSDTKSRSSYAEIAMILSSEKAVEIEINNKKFSASEIEIARKLYRSGESEYLINKKRVRLIDIHQVLASLGFGQSSYAVIGQGMVDRLLFFTASERKVLFDEAAGVKQYEIKREQAIRKLEATDGNLIRLKDILTELGPRVTNLRRLVKRAEGRKEIESELKELQTRYYSAYFSELSSSQKKLEEEKETLNKKIVQIRSEIEKIDQKINDQESGKFDQEHKNIEEELSVKTLERDELQRAVSEIESRLNHFEYLNQVAKNEAGRLSEEKDGLLQKVDFLARKITEAKVFLESEEKSKEEIARELEKIANEKQALNISLGKLAENAETNEAKALEADLAKLEMSRRDLSSEIYSLEQISFRHEQKKKEDLAKNDNLIATQNEIQEKINQLKDRLKSLRQEEQEKIASKSSREKELATIQKELVKLESGLSELAKHLEEGQIELFEKEVSLLTDETRKFREKIKSGFDQSKTGEIFEGFFGKIENVLAKASKLTLALKKEERKKLEEILNTAQQKRREVEENIHNLSLEAERTKSKIEICLSEINSLEKRQVEIKNELAEISKNGAKAVDPAEIDKKKTQLAELDAEIEKISTKLREFSGSIDSKKQVILAGKNELHEKESALNRKMYEIDLVVNQKKSLIENQTREIENSKERLEAIETKLAEGKNTAGSGGTELEKELSDKKTQLADKNSQLTGLRAKFSEIVNAGREQSQVILDFERKRRVLESDISEEKEKLNGVEIEKAKIQAREEDLQEELKLQGVAVSNSQTVLSQNEKDLARAKMENLKRRLETIGGVDPETVAEYEELSTRSEQMATQVEDLDRAKIDLEKIIKELDAKIKKQFSESFSHIATEFNRHFQILFNGGKATLTLGEDEEGNYGIEITANPPGKKLQNLSALSGGERTLTSLALLFAILSNNPSPFCVLDEVDAALDESNTLRFARILQDLAGKTQFLVISHNRETMRAADALYGITMDSDNISKLISIRLAEALEKTK